VRSAVQASARSVPGGPRRASGECSGRPIGREFDALLGSVTSHQRHPTHSAIAARRMGTALSEHPAIPTSRDRSGRAAVVSATLDALLYRQGEGGAQWAPPYADWFSEL